MFIASTPRVRHAPFTGDIRCGHGNTCDTRECRDRGLCGNVGTRQRSKCQQRITCSTMYAMADIEGSGLFIVEFCSTLSALLRFYVQSHVIVRSHYAVCSLPLRRVFAPITPCVRSHYAVCSLPLRRVFAPITPCECTGKTVCVSSSGNASLLLYTQYVRPLLGNLLDIKGTY